MACGKTIAMEETCDVVRDVSETSGETVQQRVGFTQRALVVVSSHREPQQNHTRKSTSLSLPCCAQFGHTWFGLLLLLLPYTGMGPFRALKVQSKLVRLGGGRCMSYSASTAGGVSTLISLFTTVGLITIKLVKANSQR